MIARIMAGAMVAGITCAVAACARRNAMPRPSRMAHAHPMTLKERNARRRA